LYTINKFVLSRIDLGFPTITSHKNMPFEVNHVSLKVLKTLSRNRHFLTGVLSYSW